MGTNVQHTEQLKPVPSITVRKMNFDFDAEIPKDYLNGRIYKSHFFDALNLLFPEGERFFMRAVRDCLNKMDDDELKQQARGFFGQETQHAIEHEKFFDVLDNHGYRFRKFIAGIDKEMRRATKTLPLGYRISLTAGAEHFTAVLGAIALKDEDVANSHPVMRDLIHWHAIEEIEHKAVAFDVMKKSYPSNWLRLAGYFSVMFFILAVTIPLSFSFMRQDGYSYRFIFKSFRSELTRTKKLHPTIWRELRQYLKKDFHPNHNDESELVIDPKLRLGIA